MTLPSFLPSYLVLGKPVDGVIVLVVQQAMRVQALTVAWRGEESVQWYQGATQREMCAATKVLLERTTAVPALAPDTLLQPGTYTYTLALDALPLDLPPSFEDDGEGVGSALPVLDAVSRLPRTLSAQRSHIRYAATALLEYSPATPPPSSPSSPSVPSQRLTRQCVLRIVERVSAAQLLASPVSRSTQQSFLLGGALSLEATVGNGGVLFAGQALFVRLRIKNPSSRSIDSVTLSLHESLVLKAKSAERDGGDFVHEFARRRHVLEAAVAQSVVAANTDEWVRELMLPVPVSTPCTISQASHVRRHYALHVELEVSFGSNVLLVVPVQVLQWSPLLAEDLPARLPVALDAPKA